MNLYLIILAAVFIGGIGVSFWGWEMLAKSRKVKQWPTVEGIITEVNASSEINDLLPDIIFCYKIEGRGRCRRFDFPDGTHPLPEFTQAYIKKYPVDSRVTIYYNPDDHEEATLEPGAQGDWMIITLGIMMVIGGGVAMLAG